MRVPRLGARVAGDEDDVVMEAGLLDQPDALAQLSDPRKRGRALERVVADVFRQHHFFVIINPGVARPRQTDVLATRVTEHYLIECKWRAGKADIGDIDDLRSRLERTEPGVVGVLISMGGFAESVIESVQQHRGRQILLVSATELRLASNDMPTLLRRKQEALLVDGRVLLDEPPSARRRHQRVFLPHADRRFVMSDGTATGVLMCGGGFGQFVFAHELPDIDWTPAPGVGVTLDVEPRVDHERDLRGLVHKLAALGWATPEARWSIQQSRQNWHGFGAASFVEEVQDWQRRADGPDAHHTEEVSYLDRCDGGFYTLTAALSADEYRRAWAVNVSLQLRGIPLDTTPLLQLCRTVEAHPDLYFRPRDEKSVTGRHEGPKLELVHPTGYITQPALDTERFNEWVTGVVIASPFQKTLDGPPPLPVPTSLGMLEDTDVLVCDLRHHHPRDGRPYSYSLCGIERAWTSDALVCRPIVDWQLDTPITPTTATPQVGQAASTTGTDETPRTS
jgi:hypothetical protein